jgi:hypothetical protein
VKKAPAATAPAAALKKAAAPPAEDARGDDVIPLDASAAKPAKMTQSQKVKAAKKTVRPRHSVLTICS